MLFDDKKPNYDPPEPDRPTSNSVKTLIFIMIGSVLVVFTDLVILDGKRYIWKSDEPNVSVTGDLSIDAYSLQDRHSRYMTEGISVPQELAEYAAPTFPDSIGLNNIEPAIGTPDYLVEPDLTVKSINEVLLDLESYDEESPVVSETVKDVTTKKEIEFERPAISRTGKIAVIIDDMGVTLRSKLVEILDGPLTLAYLPYAENLPERTARAKANGHELMVHLPMEPMNEALDGGPRVLSSDLNATEFESTLQWGLSQFDGYVGVNNHMGSRLTQDDEALGRMMDILKQRDVFFIDSKTISTSVAADVAKDHGLAFAERDVFLDHEISTEFIEGALRKLERIALDKGYAIAIGHPHKETIAALKVWMPTLADKGLELVPASALVNRPVVDETVAVR